MARRRHRYELHDPEMNEALEALLARAQESYGSSDGADLVREILVSGFRLLRDGASLSDLKLTNHALKELRHSFRVFAPYRHIRKVSVFGSARTAAGEPDCEQARLFAETIVRAGWMVITGAGGGIMGAAQEGAGRASSFGVNIRLPFEQTANETIVDDPKLINFRYFFTRKVTFVKESHAIALLPGGFGTHDEGLETLTLLQTGKSELLPVVFIDSPGGDYWRTWEQYVHSHLHGRGLIGEADLSLFLVTDSVDEAVREMLEFYSNYHSSRYVAERLVIRLRRAPNQEQLEALNQEFEDIVTAGAIETTDVLPAEDDEAADLSRIAFRFDRRAVGRLRMLIDRLNSFSDESASPPVEASPHEIVEGLLSEEAERRAEAERLEDGEPS